MPFYKKKNWGKKWSGKKTYYKRRPTTREPQARNTYKNYTQGGPSMVNFPATNTVAMRWSGYANVGTTGVVGTNNVYSANSVYDPDHTSGAGFSAMGLDEWSMFYNHYCVDSATITATFTIPASATPSPTPIACYIKLTDDTSDDTELSQSWMCNGNTCWKEAAQGTQAVVFQLKKHFNAADFFGLKDPMDAQSNIGALVSTNPAERAYWMVGMSSTTGSAPVPPGEATEYPCWVNVLITYNTTFTEPKYLPH